MTDITRLIDTATAGVQPSPDALDRTLRRAKSRQRRRRGTAIATALVLTVGATALAWAAFGGNRSIPAAPTDDLIVYTTQGAMTPIIQIARPDGSGRRALGPGDDPALSPDGSLVAFTRTTADGGTGIFVVSTDGTGLRRLTNNPNGEDEAPAWSPDGTNIVFARVIWKRIDPDPIATPSRRDLYTVDVDGSRLHALLGGPTDDFAPSWSPDGNRIVFDRMGGAGADPASAYEPELWILTLDGQAPVQITLPRSLDLWRPDWAPDGSSIVFDSAKGLFTVSASGNLAVTHVRFPARSHIDSPFDASWSPDGTEIAFAAGSDTHDVYIANADGTHVRRFATDAASPSWSASPPERKTLDRRCLSEDQPGLVSCARALRIAQAASSMGDISRATAELVPYRRSPESDPVLAWAVTYPSVRQYGDGPSPSCQIGDWVVTIDAHTGAYIVEGTGRDQAPSPISETRPTDVVLECAPYATPFADPLWARLARIRSHAGTSTRYRRPPTTRVSHGD